MKESKFDKGCRLFKKLRETAIEYNVTIITHEQKFANAAFGNNDKNELNCWMALDENNEKR